jgi:hypothetical protein
MEFKRQTIIDIFRSIDNVVSGIHRTEIPGVSLLFINEKSAYDDESLLDTLYYEGRGQTGPHTWNAWNIHMRDSYNNVFTVFKKNQRSGLWYLDGYYRRVGNHIEIDSRFFFPLRRLQ